MKKYDVAIYEHAAYWTAIIVFLNSDDAGHYRQVYSDDCNGLLLAVQQVVAEHEVQPVSS